MGMPNFPPNDFAALPSMPGGQPQLPPPGDPNFPMAAPPELGLAPAIPAVPQQQFAPQQQFQQPMQQQFAPAPPVGMPPLGQAGFAPDYASQGQAQQQFAPALPTVPPPMGEVPPPMPQVQAAPVTSTAEKINWKTLQTQIKNGEHDAHLDQLWASDEREGVRKAIVARQAVLSGGGAQMTPPVAQRVDLGPQPTHPAEMVVYVPVPVSKLGHILPLCG